MTFCDHKIPHQPTNNNKLPFIIYHSSIIHLILLCSICPDVKKACQEAAREGSLPLEEESSKGGRRGGAVGGSYGREGQQEQRNGAASETGATAAAEHHP
jgi:hypothetical protein